MRIGFDTNGRRLRNVQVQRAAAGALRTLAFKNEENKNLIVECQVRIATLTSRIRGNLLFASGCACIQNVPYVHNGQ